MKQGSMYVYYLHNVTMHHKAFAEKNILNT